jgi:hypothetical protein
MMKKILFPQIISFLLLVLIFWGVLEKSALKFLIDTESTSLESLAIATELILEAKIAESTRIPLVSGTFDGIADIFSKGQQWLSYSSIILGAQIMIVTVSKTLAIKVIAALLWIGIFIPRTRSICTKLLMLFFLLNPGLPAFVHISKMFGNEANINFGNTLNENLKKNYATYQSEEKTRASKLEALKEKQKKENGGKLDFFQKIGDDVKKVVGHVEDDVSLVYKDSADVLKEGSKQLIQQAVNLFIHVLVAFVLLPFGYFYLFKILFEHIVGEKLNVSLPTKIHS